MPVLEQHLNPLIHSLRQGQLQNEYENFQQKGYKKQGQLQNNWTFKIIMNASKE